MGSRTQEVGPDGETKMWLFCRYMGQGHDTLISPEIRYLTQMGGVDCQETFGWQHADDVNGFHMNVLWIEKWIEKLLLSILLRPNCFYGS